MVQHPNSLGLSPTLFRRAIADWIPPGSDVAIVDVPVHRNVGDLFILAATRSLLSDLGCRVVYSAGIRDYRTVAARRALTPRTTIVGLGGGNFGDLYPKYQALRERVVADFPERRIVILPQTLHFRDVGALARSVQLFERHPDLRIFVRDARSLEMARPMTPHVMLLPDIVDVLGGDVVAGARQAAAVREASILSPPVDTLVLRRRDNEGRGGRRVSGEDWADFFPGFHRRLAMAAVLMPLAPAAVSARLHHQWATRATDMLVRAVRLMEPAGRVETDRLHGAIAARIAGRPVTLVDNGYGKLRAYYEAWWQHDGSVTFASPA